MTYSSCSTAQTRLKPVHEPRWPLDHLVDSEQLEDSKVYPEGWGRVITYVAPYRSCFYHWFDKVKSCSDIQGLFSSVSVCSNYDCRKVFVHPISCGSRYCVDPQCIDNRVGRVKKRLYTAELHGSSSPYKTREIEEHRISKYKRVMREVVHKDFRLVGGTSKLVYKNGEPMRIFTDPMRLNHRVFGFVVPAAEFAAKPKYYIHKLRKLFNKFFKACWGLGLSNLRCIYTFDFKLNEVKKTVNVHVHMAFPFNHVFNKNRPMFYKRLALKFCSLYAPDLDISSLHFNSNISFFNWLIGQVTNGLITTFKAPDTKGLRYATGVFNYFAKRMSGVFGHKKESYHHWPDLVPNPKIFFNQVNRLRLFGVKQAHASRTSNMGIIFPHNVRSYCPLCDHVLIFKGKVHNSCLEDFISRLESDPGG